MDEEQFVTITAYDTEQVKIISLPDHYSSDEICEAIRSEMTVPSGDALILDFSLNSGEFSSIPFTPPYRKCSKETLPLGKLHRKTA
jgi:hypothetical protein